MAEIDDLIGAALDDSGPIDRERIVAWCHQASSVRTLGLLYRLTGEGHKRIDPPLGTNESYALIRRYLLECILVDPRDGATFTRYDAAQVLEDWFDRLAEMEEAEVLRESAEAVTQLFLHSGPDVQLAIETGFLEHVLEHACLRPLFAHWKDDERLRPAWTDALAWGEAHPRLERRLSTRRVSVRR